MSNVHKIDDARGGRSRRPPQDIQAEESLIGAMLFSKDAIAIASERLLPDDFYKPANAHAFEAITSLAAAGEPADPVTVADELKRAGLLDAIGGEVTLLGLLANAGAPSNAYRYAKIIGDHALLRKLIGAAGDIAETAYELPEDVPGAVDRAEAKIFELAQRRNTDTLRHFADVIETGLDNLEARYERGDAMTGLSTGFADLDDILSGLQPSALYILGARPSVGKTSLALNIATHVVLEEKKPTLVFSLEMSEDELFQRIFSAEARVDSKRLRSGATLTDKDFGKVAHATGRFADAPLYIDDNPNLTIMELRSKARRLQAKIGQLGLIVVDYLQLMTGRSKAENRQVEIAEISRGLKILARELRCPVLALSQLSRGLESRLDKRPVLSDLRESGSLEQDSDVVIFAYRDEVYNANSPDRGTAEILVSKHRSGPTGVVRLAFLSEYTKFANLARGAA